MQRLVLVVALCAACGKDAPSGAPLADAGTPDAVEEVAGDLAQDAEPTPPSPLYAGKVLSAASLIGGPGAYGQVGKAWVIGNDVARFLIQDVGVSVGLSLYGGNLIDADLVRGEGEPGNDRFRETFPAVGFEVLIPDSIHVEKDGSDGEEAMLRVQGTLGPSKILDLLDAVADHTGLGVTMDYIVRPGESMLRMRTTLTNDSDIPRAPMTADFLGFGRQLELFTREVGFSPPEGTPIAGLLATRGDGVNYAYGRPEGDLQFPFSDASGTLGILDYALIVPAGGAATYERWFVVGDGSVSSVVDPLVAAMDVEYGTATGQVVDGAGAPVEGAWVSALPAAPGVEPDHAENQALTDGDGRFAMLLSPGNHRLIAHNPSRLRSAPVDVLVDAGAESSADLTLGDEATITVAYTTDGPGVGWGGSSPVKVSLALLKGETADTRLGEHTWSGQARILLAGGGQDTYAVRPGTYRVVVSRGPEFARDVFESLLVEGEITLSGHLARVVETEDYLSCDFHQHTTASLDGSQTLVQRMLENLTAGLECAAITDHDNVVDPGPAIAELEASAAIYGVTSDEVSVNGVGHFNVYPMPLDDADPYALVGAQFWADRTIPELFETLRALPGDRILQVNHPRSDPFKGYFSYLGLDPASGETDGEEMAMDFEAIEVNASLGQPVDYSPEGWALWAAASDHTVPVLADWFGLLNRGLPICAVGNSDAHNLGDDSGYPRTYLRVGTDDPAALTDQAIVDAVRAQRAIVSRGAWLEVDVAGERPMGHTEVVAGTVDSPVMLHVVAETAPWLSLTSVDLFGNGVLVETRSIDPANVDGTVWFDEIFTLSPDMDTWYVVMTRGPSEGHPVFGGSTYAFTNPIYVDVDGGGFSAPGPVELSTDGGS